MKIYINSPKESWVVDRFVKEWKENNKNISTNLLSKADLIWIISPWTWEKISKKHLSSKKVICTIHHIDDKKFNVEEFSELDKLSNAYETMLQQFKTRATYLLMTCYEGNLAYNPQRFYGMDYTARAIVSMWNDRISRIARDKNSRNNKSSYDVLDIREVMSPKCYYNEIEPNEIGARRIAKAVKRYVNETGVLI